MEVCEDVDAKASHSKPRTILSIRGEINSAW